MLPVKMPVADLRVLECGESLRRTGGPFFHITTEHSAVKLFLDAVSRSAEEARCFISKKCIKTIDLSELKRCFDGGYKYLTKGDGGGGNCRTDIVLAFNKTQNEKSILRLYMVREPDQFGQWKIFNVERE
jgi:hypothetical protein